MSPSAAADERDAVRTTIRSIRVLAAAAQQCRGCDLYANATQAVFGEGSTAASLLLVGEQPGDQEDRRGHPFVGRAGRILWDCIDEAGLDRDAIFVTNVVKHFKHEDRGKRRIHKRPSTAEVEACSPWLRAELAAIPAPVVVALGATATARCARTDGADRPQPGHAAHRRRSHRVRDVPPLGHSAAPTRAAAGIVRP